MKYATLMFMKIGYKVEPENMKKTKRALMIGAACCCLLCPVFVGMFVVLCYSVPDFAPDFVIRWQNERRAANYLRAAQQGYAPAQRELGTRYFLGIGVPLDREEAVKWFFAATEQGDIEAQCRLAYCYFNGEGVPEDKEEAIRRYRIAAESGNVEGQWKLGAYLLNGIGVPKNEEEAVKWFHKAAVQDYYHAQYLLGRCYFEGTGVPKDDTEAAWWLRKIRWYDEAAEILKEIVSDNPRAPNPQWGEEIFRRNPTPHVKR